MPLRALLYCPSPRSSRAHRGLKATLLAIGTLGIAALSGGLLLASTASATPIEWTVASGGNGHAYDFVSADFSPGFEGWTWDDARADAIARGGDLASFSSADEWSFVTGNAATIGVSGPGDSLLGWIGLFQTDGAGPDLDSWTWVDGTPLSFAAWNGGEPNGGALENHAVAFLELDPAGSFWNDLFDQPFGYYIEYAPHSLPVPEPGTALLVGLGLSFLAKRRRAL